MIVKVAADEGRTIDDVVTEALAAQYTDPPTILIPDDGGPIQILHPGGTINPQRQEL